MSGCGLQEAGNFPSGQGDPAGSQRRPEGPQGRGGSAAAGPGRTEAPTRPASRGPATGGEAERAAGAGLCPRRKPEWEGGRPRPGRAGCREAGPQGSSRVLPERTARSEPLGPPATCRAAPRGPEPGVPTLCDRGEHSGLTWGGRELAGGRASLLWPQSSALSSPGLSGTHAGPEGGSRQGGCAGLKQLGRTYNLVAAKKSSAHPCLALVAQLSQEMPQETSLGPLSGPVLASAGWARLPSGPPPAPSSRSPPRAAPVWASGGEAPGKWANLGHHTERFQKGCLFHGGCWAPRRWCQVRGWPWRRAPTPGCSQLP